MSNLIRYKIPHKKKLYYKMQCCMRAVNYTSRRSANLQKLTQMQSTVNYKCKSQL